MFVTGESGSRRCAGWKLLISNKLACSAFPTRVTDEQDHRDDRDRGDDHAVATFELLEFVELPRVGAMVGGAHAEPTRCVRVKLIDIPL